MRKRAVRGGPRVGASLGDRVVGSGAGVGVIGDGGGQDRGGRAIGSSVGQQQVPLPQDGPDPPVAKGSEARFVADRPDSLPHLRVT